MLELATKWFVCLKIPCHVVRLFLACLHDIINNRDKDTHQLNMNK